MMGTWMPETCREETYINIFKQKCAPSWIICDMDLRSYKFFSAKSVPDKVLEWEYLA